VETHAWLLVYQKQSIPITHRVLPIYPSSSPTPCTHTSLHPLSPPLPPCFPIPSPTQLYTPLPTSVSMVNASPHCIRLDSDIESTRLQKAIIACKKENEGAFKETKDRFVDYDRSSTIHSPGFPDLTLISLPCSKNSRVKPNSVICFLRTCLTFLKD